MDFASLLGSEMDPKSLPKPSRKRDRKLDEKVVIFETCLCNEREARYIFSMSVLFVSNFGKMYHLSSPSIFTVSTTWVRKKCILHLSRDPSHTDVKMFGELKWYILSRLSRPAKIP